MHPSETVDINPFAPLEVSDYKAAFFRNLYLKELQTRKEYESVIKGVQQLVASKTDAPLSPDLLVLIQLLHHNNLLP